MSVTTQPRRLIRDLPLSAQPAYRVQHAGARSLSELELLAAVLGTPDALDLAQDILRHFDGRVIRLVGATLGELQEVPGVGQALAARILSAFELGRRIMAQRLEERPRVTSPADAANLLMADMMLLEQEHLRLILLDTRNRVLSVPTIYVGSLNTSVVRIGELLRAAIRANAAAFIAAHNHPSGDPSPSPEDVSVTRQIAQAGRLVDIEMLDHVIIGRQRYVSLKERGLGFDQ